ncbi:MAG: nitroreductase family protein [Chloroflexi bacterium]|nr:nitroreductase family protein [Chloroflexota bacterium]
MTNTNLRDFLRSRRSIRRFKADPVPDSVIEDLLATATFAPSAHNRQPWRFAVIKDPAARQRLGAALTSKMRADMQAEGAPQSEIEARVTRSLRRIDEAPALIVLCRDVTDVRVDTPEEAIMGTQSVAAAGLQLLLAAHAEGLGANWICWPLYAQTETLTALDLPKDWEPQGMIIIGHPNEAPKEKSFKSLQNMMAIR